MVMSLTFCLAGCTAVKQVKEEGPNPAGPGGYETGSEVMAQNVTFDADTGEVRYRLPEPAKVRIRVGLRDGGPMLAHVLDWEDRGMGEHKEVWNGKPNGSELDFRGRENLMLVITAMRDKQSTDGSERTSLRQAPRMSVTFPDSRGKDSAGLPVLKGRTPVRVVIDEDDARWLSNTRYELALYVDQVFLMEEEEGLNPFTYYVQTDRLRDGLHSITATLACYGGEAASLTREIVVNNRGIASVK